MDVYLILLTIGGLFIIGLAADEIGRRTRLPRVTLLMLLGVAAGPIGLNLLPSQVGDWYDLLASVSLTMVAFLLGGSLSRSQLARHGRQILIISLSVVSITIVILTIGLMAIGTNPILAVLLAGIATATAPAATKDVMKQINADGEFAETLEGIVAIDDAWGLIAFSVMLTLANIMAENGISITLQQGLWELIGACGVGALVGFPAAYLTGHLQRGEPVQAEALAVVFLCGGISLWLEVSFLLAGIVAGAIVVNFAKHHHRAFHEIEHIEWPFMIMFFFLAGASLEMRAGWDFGAVILVYILLRILSRLVGAWIGCALSDCPDYYKQWMGAALLPQAGVAIGMALVAGQSFPDMKDVLLAIIVVTTVVFEMFGPLATRIALDKAKENESQSRTTN